MTRCSSSPPLTSESLLTSLLITFDVTLWLSSGRLWKRAPSCLTSKRPSANTPSVIWYVPVCGAVSLNSFIVVSPMPSLFKTMPLKPPSKMLNTSCVSPSVPLIL